MTTPWFIPVDRRNAMAFFARGLVVPRKVLSKYRKDPQDLVPDRLLFLSGKLLPSLGRDAGLTTGELTLLEISGEVELHGPVLRDGDGAPLAAAPSGALSVQRIAAVHVSGQAESDEITARSYRNVEGSKLPVRISLELFAAADDCDLSEVRSWLQHLTPVSVDESRILQRECVAGALLLLSHGLRGQPRSFSEAADVIRRVLAAGADDSVAALVDGVSSVGWCTLPDDIALFRATCDSVVEQSGPEPPVPRDVMDALLSRLESLGLEDVAVARRQLGRVLEIARGDGALVTFKSSGGLRSVKSLLLFLLRPEPESVTSWRGEDLNAEEELVLLSLLYAGLSRRSGGVPDAARHAPLLEQAIMDWVASGVGDGEIRAGLVPEMTVEQGPRDVTLLIGGAPTLSRPIEQSEVRRRLETAEDTDPWALSLVTRMEWRDCVETLVTGRSANVEAREEGIQVSFPGPVTIQHRLARRAVEEHLAKVADPELEKAARDLVRETQE